MISCPGCGGRNDPEAKTCQWCDRPFVAQPRKIPRLVFGLVAVVALSMLLIFAAIVAVAALIANFGNRSSPEVTPTPAAPTATVAPATVNREGASPVEPTAQPAEFVRVANTGGSGAFIRDEPRAAARGIAAYPDRTILRVLGPDISSDGRLWKNVEDQRGIRGWTPVEFLVPSDSGF